jgi:hypothetical protein
MSQQQMKAAPQNQVTIFTSNPLGLPQPQEWAQIKEICQAAIRSGMLPKGINTPEAAAIIALKARELGIPLMVGFAHIHVINGKPAMSAELIQAQARKNLPGLIFNIIESNNDRCTVEACRPEKGSTPLKLTFTIEDARKANLLGKDVWKQYPGAMLYARASTALLRRVCPDALMGVSYTPEELGRDTLDSDAIETSSRPIVQDNVVEIKPVTTPPPAPEQPPAAQTLSPEEAELKQKRSQVWGMWKAAKGTEEGFKKYIQTFNAKSGQDLTMEQLNMIEHHIGAQINARPPQPVDPMEEEIKEPSDADEDAPKYDPNFDQT